MKLVVLSFETALVYSDNGELMKAYKWPINFFGNPELGMKAVHFMISQYPEKLEKIDIASLPASLFTLDTLDRHGIYSDWKPTVFFEKEGDRL